jgi:predicted CopG family antitoxin
MNLKNNLKKLSQGGLIGLLMELYRKNNENRELLESKFNADNETEVLKKYKQQFRCLEWARISGGG